MEYRGLFSAPFMIVLCAIFMVHSSSAADLENGGSEREICEQKWGAARAASCPELYSDRNDALGELARRIMSAQSNTEKQLVFQRHVAWACKQWMDARKKWLMQNPDATEEEIWFLENGNDIFEDTAFAAGVSFGTCKQLEEDAVRGNSSSRVKKVVNAI